MPDILRRCWLYPVHRQRSVEAVLCCLPAGFGVSGPVRGPLLFLAVVVVAMLAAFGILHCWGWDPDFAGGLFLCGVVVEIAVAYYGSLPLDYCQWMEQPQLMAVSVGVVMVVHAVVLPAMLEN